MSLTQYWEAKWYRDRFLCHRFQDSSRWFFIWHKVLDGTSPISETRGLSLLKGGMLKTRCRFWHRMERSMFGICCLWQRNSVHSIHRTPGRLYRSHTTRGVDRRISTCCCFENLIPTWYQSLLSQVWRTQVQQNHFQLLGSDVRWHQQFVFGVCQTCCATAFVQPRPRRLSKNRWHGAV